MTRCEEFYEKVKKDGNFCGMSDKQYRQLVLYTEEVEKDEAGKPALNQGEWENQEREQAKEVKKREAVEKAGKRQEKVFDILLVDPPWEYTLSRNAGAAETVYPTMSLDEIKVIMPKGQILFLWATFPKLKEAMEVIDAWGFDYKTALVWVKTKALGIGFNFNAQAEILLLAKNKTTQRPIQKYAQVLFTDRKKHSEKPDEIHEMIEKMYPNCSYYELFARQKHSEKWEVWGNEV